MRKQCYKTIYEKIKDDDRVVLMLGDIGVHAFEKAFEEFPDRVYNMGIAEQNIIGMSAGMAMNGLIPIAYTISPFLIERAFEQIKLDLGYQNLGVNLIGIGASCDYASLGASHYCPADVSILKQIPCLEIVVSGTAHEFEQLFEQSYNNGNPTYYRLTDNPHGHFYDVEFGKANVIRQGKDATLVVVGSMLDVIMDATKDMDVTILYYTTLSPFDYKTLHENINSKIILCEPYYNGGILFDIVKTINIPVQYGFIGIPHKFQTHYGTYQEHMDSMGLNTKSINEYLRWFINV